MAEQDPTLTPDDLKVLGMQLGMGALAAISTTGLQKALVSSHAESKGAVYSLFFKLLEETAFKAGEGMHRLEEPFLPVIAAFVAPILGGLFGADVNEAEFRRKLARGEGARGAQAIVEG